MPACAGSQVAASEPGPDLVIPAFGLVLAPAYLGTLAVWIVSGRGPGGKLIAAGQGAALLRRRQPAF